MRRADRSVSSDRSEAVGAVAVSLAAVDAVVVGVVVVDVAAEVVAAGGVRRSSMRMPKSWLQQILAAILCVGVAQAAPPNAPKPQSSFATAEEAVGAFVTALRDNKEAELLDILGQEGARVVNSGDRYADRELHQRFVALYDEKHTIDQKSPERAELDVGPEDWPMPIPLVGIVTLFRSGGRTGDRRD